MSSSIAATALAAASSSLPPAARLIGTQLVCRPRLAEHVDRVLRPELATLFSHTVRVSTVELSSSFDARFLIHQRLAFRYHAAAMIELLTGEVSQIEPCTVVHEDASQEPMTMAERGILFRAGKTTHIHGFDLDGVDDGLKIFAEIKYRDRIYHFLDKLRETFLPETYILDDMDRKREMEAKDRAFWEAELKQSVEPVTFEVYGNPSRETDRYRPTPMVLEHRQEREAARQHELERFVAHKRGTYIPPLVVPVRKSPLIATCYYRLSDLLKMPDLEAHYDALGSLLRNPSDVRLVLRAKLHVEPVVNANILRLLGRDSLDPMRIADYFMQDIFNPYTPRVPNQSKN